MNYSRELKKFVTGQNLYAGVRIAFAIIVPCIIFAYFGVLKEFFLFPLGTSFAAMTDQPGPFVRRRNSLLLAIVSFFFVALIANLVKSYSIIIFLEIIIFSMFFTMIGVYGQRLSAIGSLSLVVLSIFINGSISDGNLLKTVLTFSAGSVWFLIVFMVVSTIQPYKLAQQMIGENYIELGKYLQLKSQFYKENPDFDALHSQTISAQVKLKDLQESTREVVFKTRTIVNEATNTSRKLMQLFLKSIDLFEKIITSENDYAKLQSYFGGKKILVDFGEYLEKIALELEHLGVEIQSGTKKTHTINIDLELEQLHENYFDLRNRELSAETVEDLMVLRHILMRISEVSQEVKNIFLINSQNEKLSKSLSAGLDVEKFVPKQEKFNLQILINNISLQSSHFKHALRVTIALIIGYAISIIPSLGIGHTYWILITILAIMRPSYSTTKHRNLLRLYGTVAGALLSYCILFFIKNETVLLTILFSSLILCFSTLRENYFWGVLFMTIYIFITFVLIFPENLNVIFKDRIVDTMIAGAVAFLVSYFVFPVWEHTQNRDFMKKFSVDIQHYFKNVSEELLNHNTKEEHYRLSRKSAIISLANLSDNFQRMLSDPKNQQKNLEHVHQFVTTSHLLTAYIASLSQYAKENRTYQEIDIEGWQTKISAELFKIQNILNHEFYPEELIDKSNFEPEDLVHQLLEKRKRELEEQEFYDRRDPNRITHLTKLKNIQELLELIYDTAKDQRKISKKLV